MPAKQENIRLPTWASSRAAPRPAVSPARQPEQWGLVTSSVLLVKNNSRPTIQWEAWSNSSSSSIWRRGLGAWECLIVKLGKPWRSLALRCECGGSHSHFQQMFIQMPSTNLCKRIKWELQESLRHLLPRSGFNHFQCNCSFHLKLLFVTYLVFHASNFSEDLQILQMQWKILSHLIWVDFLKKALGNSI